MRKILILGSPNVGKSTLFNSLTKSSEHTGNFHGVTVDKKRKVIKFNNQDYEFVDLPGIYSLKTFSCEEEVSKCEILKQKSDIVLLLDANNLRKNLYLALQLSELGINYQILINNYDYFVKFNNKINIEKLSKLLNKKINIINAKKIKINEFINLINPLENSKQTNFNYLNIYFEKINKKYNLNRQKLIKFYNNNCNFEDEENELISSVYEEIVSERYKAIDEIIEQSVMVDKDYIYGSNKLDKFLLNPVIMVPGFFLVFFLTIYLIFFSVGPFLSDGLNFVYTKILVEPVTNFLLLTTDNIWIIELISVGVFSSISTILLFIPELCLLYVFITILEDSGILARMCYVFDDFLSKIGLNGKAIYIMLLGLGCNTMSCMVCRNMSDRNMRKKTAILSPYISCMARLPIYIIIASTFFGKNSFFAITGLYILGFVLTCLMAYILNRKKLKTIDNSLLIEFPPIRNIDMKHVFSSAKTNAIDLFKRIFVIVLSVGVIIWILTHTMFNLQYTDNINDSVLFSLAQKISFIFKPIGLNNPGVVSALFVGLLAKELVLSTFSISNNVFSNQALKASLIIPTSVVNFNIASALSFLIFFSIYSPCLSNLAVIKKEIGVKSMWFSLISQLLIAYSLSFVVYNIFRFTI